MNLEKCHLDAIINSNEFSTTINGWYEDYPQLNKSLDEMTTEDYDGIYNAIYDLWRSDSPVVAQITANGSCGVFLIQIYGVEGAYYIFAPEFDDMGPFITRQEAIDVAKSEYCTFI